MAVSSRPLARLVRPRQQRFDLLYLKKTLYFSTLIAREAEISLPWSRKSDRYQGFGLRQFIHTAAPTTMPMQQNEAYTTPSITDLESEKKSVCIIGGSIAGTVLALQLLSHPTLRAKFHPVVFDGAATLPNLGNPEDAISLHPEGQTGAAVALTKQAMWPLRQLNLGLELDEISLNAERLAMYRQPFFGPQDGSQKGVSILDWHEREGIMGGIWAVDRGSLQALLIKNILARGGEVIANKKLINIVEHDREGSRGLEVTFADRTSYHCDLLVGADGAWSTVRKLLYTASTASGEKLVDEAWKPDYQNIHIVHGISRARTTDTSPTFYAMSLTNVGTGSWTLKGNRQMWTIYEAPCAPPPTDTESRALSDQANKVLSEKWNMDVFTGGYDQASTEQFMQRYRKVWHPSAGTYGHLFNATEKIVRVGLWQKVFDRLGNVQWLPGEVKPKECKNSTGGTNGKGNIVLIGDAARVLMPTAGQGAGFAIEDATVLADCLLNHPPNLINGTSNFSDAIKEHTRQRLPRYTKISTLAYWGARIAIGRTWADRLARDYLSTLSPRPKSNVGNQQEKTWWQKLDGQEWLLDPKFEVRLREGEHGLRDQ